MPRSSTTSGRGGCATAAQATPPNRAVHRTAAAESDCGVIVIVPPRPVTLKFGRRGPRVGDHLPALESAISDLGCWTWWAANLPSAFQVEFGGTQLWNPPSGEGQPPSSRIALRF